MSILKNEKDELIDILENIKGDPCENAFDDLIFMFYKIDVVHRKMDRALDKLKRVYSSNTSTVLRRKVLKEFKELLSYVSLYKPWVYNSYYVKLSKDLAKQITRKRGRI